MSPIVGETESISGHWTKRVKFTGPIGVFVMLVTMAIILVAEPALGWVLLPSALLGVLIAVILHSWKTKDIESAEGRPEIQISKIPVKGAMGLVFTVGMMAMFFAALPEVRLFLLLALPCGALIGGALYLWHKRHPLS